MSSTLDATAHPVAATFPPITSMPSTDVSSLISEKDSNAETESKATISSATPKSSQDDTLQDTIGQQDHGQLPAETRPELDADDEVGSELDLKDDVSETSKTSGLSNNTARRFGESHLRDLARGLRLKPLSLRDTGPEEQGQFTVDFANHLKMMNWVTDILADFDKPPHPSSSSSSGEYRERTPGIPQMHDCTWSEWWGSPPSDFAVQVLAEEEPPDSTSFPDRRRRTAFDEGTVHPKPVLLQPRLDGVMVLPDRIRINSLPVRRILETLTNGRLWSFHNSIIYRPYKVLQWLEPKIRQKQSDIQHLYNKGSVIETEPVGLEDPPGTETSGPTDCEMITKPPMSKEDREEIIFTPRYDWKYLTQSELREADLDLGTLVSFIDKYISPIREALQGRDDFQIHYQELWHAFKPGTDVYVKDPAIPQKLWRVVRGRGGQKPLYRRAQATSKIAHMMLGGALNDAIPPPFWIDCYHLDFDGNQFIRVFKQFKFEWFEELASVRSLPIIPLNIAEREGLIDLGDCRIRGQDFISYTKWSYSYYQGQSLISEPDGTALRRPEKGAITSAVVLSEAIESPVVVDFHRCLQEIPDWKPGRLPTSIWVRAENVPQEKPSGSVQLIPPPPGADDDRLWDTRLAEEVLNYTNQSKPLEVYGREPPEGDEILLLPDRVFAFVLRTRRWACIPLGSGSLETQGHSLTRMKRDHLAWNQLQIDDGHRTIIKSLMATHFSKNKLERRQFDVIQDKGSVKEQPYFNGELKETNKTVATYYNKPLLPITCGDLGMTPTDVEANLQAAFQMAQAWECVLLLDEADVFLAERSQDNIERNALVSVFLRVMEYYEGILFLTTNKVGSFDEAFKSRMSMALYYPPLTHDQTKKIWEVQMDRTEELSKAASPRDPSKQVKFNRDEIRTLSTTLWALQTTRDDHRPVWNGRQIRNAFQTAVALAEFHQQENHITGPIIVKGEHFDKVAKVSHEFNAYLYSVRHERLDNELAHKKEHRYDDFNRHQFGLGGQGFGMPQQGGYQQGFGMPGGFQTPQQFGMMGMGMPNMGMSGSGFSNLQNPGSFVASQSSQPNFGNMGNLGMGNVGMGNSNMGNTGLVNVGLGNSGMSGQNAAMGAQQGNSNSAGIPGQNLAGQMTPQQQQQLQELLRLQQQQ
ncbi:hypothetical protein CORC01_08405 [Colletotrichum orchidophilum]|uniref:Uncharacterized protein n=1 Tax=Colletotrichum orchidophilum TaxID=1209926 RepID=A0A1G4B4T6_9PEZI|nr:uncharacterized protein CORC01_08405 [Colletotrichum orchidophilum]OHE96333.1 hypothetical protein CORC01_08405 [Colletotrichum orchidophilum]